MDISIEGLLDKAFEYSADVATSVATSDDGVVGFDEASRMVDVFLGLFMRLLRVDTHNEFESADRLLQATQIVAAFVSSVVDHPALASKQTVDTVEEAEKVIHFLRALGNLSKENDERQSL